MPLRLIPDIHRATHRIAVYLARTEAGASQGEAHILAHLMSFGDSTVADLHRAFAHKRSTLTSILDRLAARGLIHRETSARDRRSFVISLTGPGKKLGGRVYRNLEVLETRALKQAGKAQLEGFRAILKALEKAGA